MILFQSPARLESFLISGIRSMIPSQIVLPIRIHLLQRGCRILNPQILSFSSKYFSVISFRSYWDLARHLARHLNPHLLGPVGNSFPNPTFFSKVLLSKTNAVNIEIDTGDSEPCLDIKLCSPNARERGVIGPPPNPTFSLNFLLHNFLPVFERN